MNATVAVLIGLAALCVNCKSRLHGGVRATTTTCLDVLTDRDKASTSARSLESGLKLLWRRSISTGGGLTPGLVLTANRLAITASEKLYLLDRRAFLVRAVSNERHEFLSSPIAEPLSETFVAVGESSIFAVGKDGERRWIQRLDRSLVSGEMLQQMRPLLSPRGEVVFAGVDGFLRVMDIADGTLRSKRAVGTSSQQSGVELDAGMGTNVFASKTEAGILDSLYLISLRDSRPMTGFGDVGRPISAVLPVGAGRAVGYGYSETKSPNGTVSLTGLDACGRARWKGPEGRWFRPLSVSDDGSVFASERSPTVPNSEVRLVKYGIDGALLAEVNVDGPVAAAILGADRMVQVVQCIQGGVRVTAFTDDLRRRDSLDVDGRCPMGIALGEDGILFLAAEHQSQATHRNSDVEVLAIQTQSPGPARSGWPMLRSDNAGTGWWR